MQIRAPLIFASMAFLLAACTKPVPNSVESSPPEGGRRSYEVRGIVRGAITDQNSLTIEHEDVPGFMPSMTMPFGFKDRREVAGLKPGDGIQFMFVLTDKDSWMEQVKKIDPATVRLPNSEGPRGGASSTRLKEGDRMPEFKLVDQAGRELTRESVKGKALLFTFIFTRCPVPNFCPLMSKNFNELQQTIAADSALKGRVQLLSISFDPEHDTPEILAKYASSFTKDGDSWRFAIGSREETDKLTQAFSVYVREEGGTLSHGLCTVMVSPDGTIRKIWRGNAWEVAEVVNALHELTAAK